MTRTTSLTHRLGLLGTMAAVVLAPTLAASTVAAQAGSTPSGATPAVEPAAPDIPLNVATELRRLGGPTTRLDTSSAAVKCVFGADPAPLTYSTREIVLRDPEVLTTAQAEFEVDSAIGGGPGRVDFAEAIPLPTVPGPAERVAAAPLTPVFVVHVVPRGGEDQREMNVVLVARRLRADHVTASPNYLMAPQPKDGPVGILPNGYPENTDIVTPPRTAVPPLGDGTNAFVMDVGLPPDRWANLPTNVEEYEPGSDREVLDLDAPRGKVDRYWAGHTAAISSTLETLVPGATVQAVKVTSTQRIITDVSATTEMSDALQNATDAPEVVVASFGSAACDSPTGEMVPLGLQAIAEAVERRGDSVLVAAAGNNSTNRRFYPAAFERAAVIAVGALDVISATDPVDLEETGMWISETRSGPPADFSNYGPWVDAWAPGHGLPVRHIEGLRFLKRLDEMTGQATVDGTSYAAPVVGSLVLEQLSLHGGTPLAAWQAIRAAGAPCDAALGGKAVALSAMDDFADTPAVGKSECVLAP